MNIYITVHILVGSHASYDFYAAAFPAREFVNSVWCIKILSPEEVHQMGKQGLELLNSVPIQRLSNTNCDDYSSRQESRNLSSGIASVGSLDY